MKDKKYSWNLTDLYKSDDDPKMEKDFTENINQSYAFINKWKNRTDYLKDPKILKEALDEYNGLAEKYGIGGSVDYYLSLRNLQDQNNKDIIKKLKQIEKKELEIINDEQFFELKLSKISTTQQKVFLKSKLLLPYKHYLERLFAFSKHLLSNKEEKILNLTSSPSHSNWVDMTEQFLSRESITIIDEEGKKQTIPLSANKKYLQSKKQKVRDIASKETLKAYGKWSDVAEHEINSVLESKRITDKLRKYERPDESRHISDDISTKTVDAMLSSVTEMFSTPQKFYELKAKLFKKKKLNYFERYLPYGKVNTKYSFEEAMKINEKTFEKLDPDFKNILLDMYNNGKYDVFPSKGKKDGACCISTLKTLPTYILLNHVDNLDSVLTIAHETGHAINSYLNFEKQKGLNTGTPLSIAEVSSTFFEDFVLEDITKDLDDETKLSLLIQKLDDDIGAIHRQVACYKFEQELHEKFREEGFLSKEKIGEIFQKHMVAYMGEYVKQDKGSEYFWVVWSHIRTFFYVYSYASGLLISKALQRMVRENPKDISKVKKMLSTGTSQSPEEMFKEIDIDITKKEFWDKGLQEIEDTYQEAYALAKKLGKI
jgi:oligoendopeptidase F